MYKGPDKDTVLVKFKNIPGYIKTQAIDKSQIQKEVKKQQKDHKNSPKYRLSDLKINNKNILYIKSHT